MSLRLPFGLTGLQPRKLFCAIALMASPLWAMAQQAQMNLPHARLSAGMHLLDVQLAQTPQERQIGLMFRKDCLLYTSPSPRD